MNFFLRNTFVILFIAVASFGAANEMNRSHRTVGQHLSTSRLVSTSSSTTANLRNANQHYGEPENCESSIVSRLNVDNGQDRRTTFVNCSVLRGGGIANWIPAGYNPFGYKITELGMQFLEFEGSLDSDVGRFLASVKHRKQLAELKAQWLEIVRVAKTGQTMRIYRTMDELISFCIKARLLD
jgi:hypothetical protein